MLLPATGQSELGPHVLRKDYNASLILGSSSLPTTPASTPGAAWDTEPGKGPQESHSLHGATVVTSFSKLGFALGVG